VSVKNFVTINDLMLDLLCKICLLFLMLVVLNDFLILNDLVFINDLVYLGNLQSVQCLVAVHDLDINNGSRHGNVVLVT